jgi:hypothetical protein
MQNVSGGTCCHLEDQEINGEMVLRCILCCEGERWMLFAESCVCWWALVLAV